MDSISVFYFYEYGAACYFHFVWHMNIYDDDDGGGVVVADDDDDALAHDLIKFARLILVLFLLLFLMCNLLSVQRTLKSELIKRCCTFDSKRRKDLSIYHLVLCVLFDAVHMCTLKNH